MSVEVSSFGKTKDGKEAKLYKVTNAVGARAEITDFGATLVRLFIPNDKGEVKDVVLGFPDVSGYEKCTSYLGATIGPNSNRIGGCKFSIDGVEYKLANNDSGNNLHSDDDLTAMLQDVYGDDLPHLIFHGARCRAEACEVMLARKISCCLSHLPDVQVTPHIPCIPLP